MIIGHAELAACAVKPSQFPSEGLPEAVFAGKSNVGKSTLINALAGRKKLARSSSAPGKTRTLNFYSMDKKLMLVDLPGYGYAKISKSESAKWGKMVESYLVGRKQIKCVLMLTDIRRDPDELDMQLFEWLGHFGFETAIIAAKCDKIGRPLLHGRIKAIAEAYSIAKTDVLPCSSLAKTGLDSLWEYILGKAGAVLGEA
jgi:GTP-binding protein